tara:strand:+ start:361 stop:741 length:381 start_codon:yes stop_codon:yes gene_type:complete
LSPAAAAWAKTILPKARTDGFFAGSVSPKEQMMLMARDFCAGDEMTPPLPHIMTPPKEGIWRFRTPDLRFVGWFPTKGAYIVSEIELKSHCTAERDQELLDAATQFRAELSIDNPNLRGEKLNELL